MKYPHFLREGGSIGLVAPSFGCAIEPYHTAFQNALRIWKEKGYRLQLGPNCYENKGIGISNTPRCCAEEFMTFYTGKESDVLISCGGGELMCEILEYLDFNKLAASTPKWFMGYSDNTNLTFLLTTLTDTAAIYGPCAAAFGMEPWHEAIQDALFLLEGKKLTIKNYPLWEAVSKKDETHPLEPYHVTEPFALAMYPKKEHTRIKGRLIGGCLDCLKNLAGTWFDQVDAFCKRYADDGILWFLESCDLNVMDMRRALWNLREAGWFSHCSGFLIGRPMHYDEPMMGLDRHSAVTEILKPLNVPIIMDLDIGHTAPMMPLVSGAYAVAEVSGNHFSIEMKLK